MTITVEPDQLTAGGQATVSVSGSSATGQVSVDVDNGEGGTDTVAVTLDENGDGSATWNVPPTWETANFNYGSCLEVSRPIQEDTDT